MASKSNRTEGSSESGDEYIVIDTPQIKPVKIPGNEQEEIDAPIESPLSENGDKNILVEPPNGEVAPNRDSGEVKILLDGMCAKMKGRVFKDFPMILTLLQFVLTILMIDLPNPSGLLFVGHMTLLLIAPKIVIYVFNVEEKYFGGPTWIHRELLSSVGVTILNLIGGLVTTIDSANTPYWSNYREWSGYLPAGICGLTIAILGGIDTTLLVMRHVRCTTKP